MLFPKVAWKKCSSKETLQLLGGRFKQLRRRRKERSGGRETNCERPRESLNELRGDENPSEGVQCGGGELKYILLFTEVCDETDFQPETKLQVELYEDQFDVNRSDFLFPPMLPLPLSRTRLQQCKTAPPPNCNNR